MGLKLGINLKAREKGSIYSHYPVDNIRRIQETPSWTVDPMGLKPKIYLKSKKKDLSIHN